MKRLLIPLIIAMLLSLTVIPVSAQRNGPGGPYGPFGPTSPHTNPQGAMVTNQQSGPRSTFAIAGVISAIDPVTYSITITVIRGNRLAQPFIDTEIVVATNENTKFIDRVLAKQVTFGELEVGDYVSVNGVKQEDLLTAYRITVGAILRCLQ